MFWRKKTTQERALAQARRRPDDFRNTFTTGHGRRVLTYLMQSYHVFSPTHTMGDPYQSAYHEGQRSVVLQILSFMNLNPDEVQEQINKTEQEQEEDFG
jgi:hypothetical protein